jgi:hypothetical protein
MVAEPRRAGRDQPGERLDQGACLVEVLVLGEVLGECSAAVETISSAGTSAMSRALSGAAWLMGEGCHGGADVHPEGLWGYPGRDRSCWVGRLCARGRNIPSAPEVDSSTI